MLLYVVNLNFLGEKMSIDLDAIRRKLAKLEGNNTRANFWSLKPGEDAKIRLVAFPNNDGQPFKELMFYYNIGDNRGLVAPYQFNKPDPFQELIKKLQEDVSPASKELLKKLYPRMRCYAAVIVRGEEDQGIKIWSFGKTVYQSLLKILLDEDYGDITCPKKGHDITVSVTHPPGKSYPETAILPRPKSSPLTNDDDLLAKWLDNVPDPTDSYEVKTYEELEKIINDWLNADDDTATDDDDGNHTTRGGTNKTSKNVVDDDVDDDDDDDDDEEEEEEIKPKKSSKKENSKENYKSLDDAFADLEDL
jgi:hypothetical protein